MLYHKKYNGGAVASKVFLRVEAPVEVSRTMDVLGRVRAFWLNLILAEQKTKEEAYALTVKAFPDALFEK